jgi:N-terminal acetyltransferase B complex non-catalytic subunit
LIRYSDALADWLEPYHNHVRPPPALVLAEAAKQNDLKIGHPIRGLELNTSNSSSTNGKKDEEAPAFKEPPEVIQRFFDGLFLFRQIMSFIHMEIPQI